MAEFLASLAAFVAAHVLPSRTGLRARAIARWGRGSYMVAYSALSLALVVWVIAAARRAPYVELWPQAPWQAMVPLLLMPVALALLVPGLALPNPLSISLVRADPDKPLADIVRVTRHPVLWGFGLWALAHLVPNGDLVSAILFAGLAVFAFAGMAVLDRRHRRRLGVAAWRERVQESSAIPLAAVVAGRTRLRGDAATTVCMAVGMVLYVVLLSGGHAWFFGVDPLAAL